jgi:hypothetical protein
MYKYPVSYDLEVADGAIEGEELLLPVVVLEEVVVEVVPLAVSRQFVTTL